MAFGFKRIMDASPLSIKDLNDQLEMLWKKTMGGVTSYDFSAGEAEKLLRSSADVVRVIAGATGRTNLVRNGRGEHGLSGFEAAGAVVAGEADALKHAAFTLGAGKLTQYGVRIEGGKLYTFSCLARGQGGLLWIRLFGQNSTSLTAKDTVILDEACDMAGYAEFTPITKGFAAPSGTLGAFLEIESQTGCVITDLQIVAGGEPMDWVSAENEIFASGIEVFDDKVNIATPNFSLKILDGDDPVGNPPKLTMSADVNGFDYLTARKLEAGSVCLVNEKENVGTIYVSSLRGNDANSGLNAQSPLKTIGEAVRRLPKFSSAPLTILLRCYDKFYESVNIYGYPGSITINSYEYGDAPRIFGKVIVADCAYILFIGIDVQDDVKGSGPTLKCDNSAFELRFCHFYRGAGSSPVVNAVSAQSSRGLVRNCSFSEYTVGVNASFGSTLHVTNCTGSCNTPVSVQGALVTGYLTWPGHVIAPYVEKEGGKVLSAGTSQKVESLGTPVESSAQTLLTIAGQAVYKNNQIFPEATDLYQGYQGGAAYASALFFDRAALLSALEGRLVASARMYIMCRETASGNAKIHLVGFDMDNPAPAVASPAKDYGAVSVIPMAGRLWFGVPDAAMTDYVAGTVKSLGFMDDKPENYFRAYGAKDEAAYLPRLEVTHVKAV